MPGLLQGLEIGRRALLTSQYALQTAGHNIANVNTPGYTRQRVTLSSTMPSFTSFGSIGSGVQIDNVLQVRDYFLGEQYRDAQKSLGRWQYKEKTLSHVQTLFNEPNDNSLADQLNQFWDSWSELSTDATSMTARKNVLAQANIVVNGFNQLAQKLNDQRQALNQDLANMTSQINLLSSEIGRLNGLIKRNELSGTRANDLRDARDLLIDQLSEYIDVNTVEKSDGSNMVQIGAMVIVDGPDAFAVSTDVSNENGRPINRLVMAGSDVGLTNLNGVLAGLLESRDVQIPEYLAQLDDLAATFVSQVNAIHSAGYGEDGGTGVNFFDPNYTSAATIRINSELNGSGVSKVAASGSATGVGDNSIALAISGLRTQQVAGGGSMSINDFYNSLVGKLGVETQEAMSFRGNYELLVNQVDNARQSVQGVSLDEEMANLIKYQHAYEAAARVITTMDQALDTLILRTGIVGR